MNQPILAISDVRKQYGRAPALNGVSLDVQAGELFGLLGPNGAGKTTLMSILAGLLDATSGTVTLFGQPLSQQARSLRQSIGIATQDLALYPELTARENLTFFGRLYGLAGEPLRHRVEELLAGVGLTERGDDRAGTFSGGMKRRLNLAIAVIHRPKLLLLDEPTTGVDPQSRNHIFEQVRSLNAAGMTMIYTSHYMEEVQALCPRIAIMDQGRMLACDTLPNLLRRLESVLHLQFDTPPETLRARLAELPGVTGCTIQGQRVELTTPNAAPLLPRIATVCAELAQMPTTMELQQPTLERVFLHLTGHDLRD
ncbi:MAG: ABC transporter ATP-binding protein [Bacteroidales bacterium]|nr:ABC transporter ATP-binding protein [Bacteroidales bacterium]